MHVLTQITQSMEFRLNAVQKVSPGVRDILKRPLVEEFVHFEMILNGNRLWRWYINNDITSSVLYVYVHSTNVSGSEDVVIYFDKLHTYTASLTHLSLQKEHT